MLALLLGLTAASLLQARSKDLEVVFVDVEGGQSTLMVTPTGDSILIDTGWPDNAYRDADRIVKAAKLLHLKKIDYVLITHYHMDHVGGVPQLVAKIPVGTFIDHGPSREASSKMQARLEANYKAAIVHSQHLVLKPGDKVPVKGIDGTVVSADGVLISTPLPGAGAPNPFCASTPSKETDPTENARSLGTVWQFGKFRMVDLGDLTWNKELALMCPDNRLGKADVLVVSHHGIFLSSSPALVHALAPRVAVMDNGAKKGGSPATFDTIKSSPGLEDLWQLHFSDEGGKSHNPPDAFIANIDPADTGFWIRLTVHEDGSFDVYNQRNKFSKHYAAR